MKPEDKVSYIKILKFTALKSLFMGLLWIQVKLKGMSALAVASIPILGTEFSIVFVLVFTESGLKISNEWKFSG